ncbi:unnamed protein product [Rhizoctonia solani]|uniref:Uncharacterized protein n=1 Tax=Rhizoctonia solani TaxID=456999 RepID=A0A8H2WZK4_9AGAM|nr:unnamed protein product [Rhizoctonia solani]
MYIVAKREFIRAQPRRCFPKDLSIVTLVGQYARFPLRTGTYPAFTSSLNPSEEPHRRLCVLSTNDSKAGLPGAPQLSLQTTLYDGSHKFPIAPVLPIPSTTYNLFVLAVGVAYDGLKDPQHDLDILNALFSGRGSENVFFRGISGEDATIEVIEDAMGKLYREALKSSESNMLILLTGEGDDYNRMYLMGGTYITDRDLRSWMWKLQIDSHPETRAVAIVLDYCRTNENIPIGVPHIGVEFVWSCYPGQTAAGLRFPNRQDVPRSCFLLALMMASHEFARKKKRSHRRHQL